MAREVQRIQTGQSILDGVRSARSLAQSLGSNDHPAVSDHCWPPRPAYLAISSGSPKPKPAVDAKPFTDDYITGGRSNGRNRQWFDLVRLALTHSSTKVISLYLWSHEPVVVPMER